MIYGLPAATFSGSQIQDGLVALSNTFFDSTISTIFTYMGSFWSVLLPIAVLALIGTIFQRFVGFPHENEEYEEDEDTDDGEFDDYSTTPPENDPYTRNFTREQMKAFESLKYIKK